MTTIADKLTLLANTKAAIETAIEAKGVDVPLGLPFSGYPAKIAAIQSGGSVEPNNWEPHPDWYDISTVGDNEINLLVSDGGVGIAFSISLTGTYSIDWGDGTTETGLTSGTRQHQYAIGTGKVVEGGLYSVFKIRIYDATGNIINFAVAKYSGVANNYTAPILWAVFGTRYLNSFANAFYGTGIYCYQLECVELPTELLGANMLFSSAFYSCYALKKVTFPSEVSIANYSYTFQYCTSLREVTFPSVNSATSISYYSTFSGCESLEQLELPASWGNATTTYQMFNQCYSLSKVNLPASWGSITTTAYMFVQCRALKHITLPTSWGSITTTEQMFNQCTSLISVILPASWGGLINVSYMFYNCWSLTKLTLPAEYFSGASLNAFSFLSQCYSLREVVNLDYLGSVTAQANLDSCMKDCEQLTQNVSISSLVSKFGMYGASGKLLKITSIRLPNAGALYAGTSPQVNVSYTSLAAAALNALFGDLPVLSGKTIQITGCPGAATCDRSIATAKGWTVTG